jgi:hypothetical protein
MSMSLEGTVRGPVASWRQTRLAVDGALSDIPGIGAITALLDDAEAVLRAGDSGPGDFTLHDEGHAFRVAEWIAEIAAVDEGTRLSRLDSILLLSAAYLHDIGMTPPAAKVRGLLDHLLTGSSDLSNSERDELQEWLDDEHNGVTAPLPVVSPSLERSRRARRLVAEYVRHRHNDWSEAWMREAADTERDGLYSGWIEDLVLLCRSHHYDVAALQTADFDPRVVGGHGEVLHLRYCACLLRIADLLDFDPERTPQVVYRHRDVDQTSAIFWARDHELGFAREGHRLVIHAKPASAYLHRAVVECIDALDVELALCCRLKDRHPFEHVPDLDGPQPYRWPLESSVHQTITPRAGSYTYVDGNFRPDVGRVLDLLGGVELYQSNDFAAVRETLQNAFDAVRERIARQRLRSRRPLDPAIVEGIQAVHRVELTVEAQEDGGIDLVCSDTGIGMSKDLIVSRFLISGSTQKHAERQLERECRERGFRVGRTARFGIGVLSYFIIASRLVVCTRRSDDAPDADSQTWRFETQGLDDFGELTSLPSGDAGTTVRLRLRDEVVGVDPESFCARLRDYLLGTLEYLPCAFEARFEGTDLDPLVLPSGWVDKSDRFATFAVSRFTGRGSTSYLRSDNEMIPKSELILREAQSAYWKDLRDTMRAELRWHVAEGELPKQAGRYEIRIPFFERNGEFALFYRHPDDDPSTDQQSMLLPGGERRMSWNGIGVTANAWFGTRSQAVVRIDWTDDSIGQIAVSRSELSLNETGQTIEAFVNEQAAAAISELALTRSKERLALVNSAIAGSDLEAETPLWWPDEANDAWSEIGFPAATPPGNLPLRVQPLFWKAKRLSTPSRIRMTDPNRDTRLLSWVPPSLKPTHLAICAVDRFAETIVIWERDTRSESRPHHLTAAVSFPPAWANVCFTRPRSLGVSWVLNERHPLVEALDAAGWRWAQDLFRQGSFDPEPYADDLAASRANASAWLLCFLRNLTTNVGASAADNAWQWALENRQGILRIAWQTVMPDVAAVDVVMANPAFRGTRVDRFSLDGIRRSDLRNSDVPSTGLGEDWTVTAEEG